MALIFFNLTTVHITFTYFELGLRIIFAPAHSLGSIVHLGDTAYETAPLFYMYDSDITNRTSVLGPQDFFTYRRKWSQALRRCL